MPFPTQGWPPSKPSNRRTLRVYYTGTATASWSDNAYLFRNDPTGGTEVYTPTPLIRPGDVTTQVNVGTAMGGNQPNALLPDGAYPAYYSAVIRIINTGANPIQFSFSAANDASTDVHGEVPAGATREYRDRHEAGIALRGPTGNSTFVLEVW